MFCRIAYNVMGAFSPKCDCLANVNGDGMLTPTDFTTLNAAFNSNAPEYDQNREEACTQTDFTAGCD
ncbi:MAG: hypothetical protein Phyf2KO_00650 [Phycisphaerales bacterium]